MRVITLLPILLIFGCIPCWLYAQEHPATINFNTTHGLPSPEVYHVFQDHEGYLWFTTDRGISRYNGYEFTNYNSRNAGLTCSSFFKIHEAPNHDLWFNGYDGSIMIYRIEQKVFESFPLQEQSVNDVGKWLQQIHFKEGRAYLLPMYPQAVTEFNLSDGTFKLIGADQFFNHPLKSDQNKWPYQFFTSDYDRSAIITWTADIVLSEKTVMKEDTLYFFFNTTLFGNTGDTIFEVRKFPETIQYLYSDSLYGLFILTFKAIYHLTGNSIREVYSGHSFSSMCRDNDGNYWFTTLEKGVFKIPALSSSRHPLPDEHHHSEKTTALAILNDNLLIGTSNGSLHVLNKNSTSIQTIFSTNSNSEYIKSIHTCGDIAYASGVKWIRQEDGNIIYGTLGSFEHCLNIGRDSLLLINYHSVYSLGTFSSQGILEFNNQGNLKDRVICVEEDTAHNYWLGTHNGVWRLFKGQWRDPVKIEGVAGLDGRINDILPLSDKNALFATIGNGVVMIKDADAYALTTAEGLASDIVNCITKQNDSVFWAGTNKGISRIKLQNLNDRPTLAVVDNFSSTDIHIGNFVYDLMVWKDELWIASDDGLFSFNFEEFRSGNNAPKLSLSGIWVADSNRLSHHVFGHNQNDLVFSFEGRCFKRPAENFYKYRLKREESDENWTFTNNRSASFFNLSPGNYTFELSARNNNDIWAEPLTYAFTIVPHFTQTAWFIVLMASIVIGIIIIFLRWRFREVKARERRKSQIQELELSSLRNQMNPHFVFNALNSVQNFMVNTDIPTAMAYLGKFSGLMRNSLNFSRQTYITLREEVLYIRNYLEIEQVRFPDRFTYSILIPKALEDCDYKIPPLLLQPILENAIKHAFTIKKEKGLLTVQLEKIAGKNELKWTIEDNGIGIYVAKKNQTRESSGLRIVYERIALMNQRAGKNQSSITIADLSRQNASGTRVEITLPILN